ncbi:MAG: sigma-70 family RNA polymerase sigma factor [Coleofasciculaceae cyanobacterium]
MDIEQLQKMVTEACSHQPGSAARQKYLTKIIRQITPKLWKEYTAYYQDALQQTWIYFCQNICEGNTGQPYNPSRGSVTTWLNFYLKRRLQDFYIDEQKQKAKTATLQTNSSETSPERPLNPVENLPASPDIPTLLQEVTQWVETDPNGELTSIHLLNQPAITAQVLILRRLPPEASWKDLSEEFNVSVSTLSSFYQRQCLPRLRKFGENEGYL